MGYVVTAVNQQASKQSAVQKEKDRLESKVVELQGSIRKLKEKMKDDQDKYKESISLESAKVESAVEAAKNWELKYIVEAKEAEKLRAGYSEVTELKAEVERLKLVEAEKIRLEAQLSALEKLRDAYHQALEDQRQAHSDSVMFFVGAKKILFDRLLNCRLEAVRDFLKSPSFAYLNALTYDHVRSQGFNSLMGQLMVKELLSLDVDLEEKGVSVNNDGYGNPDPEIPVVDEEVLFKDEFAHLVVNEEDIDKVKNGGPYLPAWTAEILKDFCFEPFSNFIPENKNWMQLPGPILGRLSSPSLFEEAAAERLAKQIDMKVGEGLPSYLVKEGVTYIRDFPIFTNLEKLKTFAPSDREFGPYMLQYHAFRALETETFQDVIQDKDSITVDDGLNVDPNKASTSSAH